MPNRSETISTNCLATCFSHALPQSAILHEKKKVLGDVGYAGSVFGCSWIWKHDAMTLPVVVAFTVERLGDLSFLCHLCQECCLAMDHGVAKCHGIDCDHRPFAGVRLNLNHAKALQPRRRGINVAGRQ